MKKLLLSIATLAMAISCSDLYTEDILPTESQTDEAQTTFVKLNLQLEGEEQDLETRVLVTEGESESDPWTVAWETGDLVHVYSIEHNTYKTLTYDGTSFSGDVYLGKNRVYYNNNTFLATSVASADDNRPYIYLSYSNTSAKPYMVSSDVINIDGSDDNDDDIVSSELDVKMKHLGAMVDFGMMFTGISSDLNIKLTSAYIGDVPEGGNEMDYTCLPRTLNIDPALSYDDADVVVVTGNEEYGSICTRSYLTDNCVNGTEFSYIFGVMPFTLESGKKLSVTLEFNGGLFLKTFDITNDTGADFEFARATHSYLRRSYDLSDLSSDGLWIFDAVPFADQSSAGTEDDPIEIASEEELAYLAAITRSMTDASIQEKYCSAETPCYFKLTADLDLSGQEWTPIGMESNYGNYFNFDGDNHTISGLTIEDSGFHRGLFTNICGTVKNLNLENVNVTGVYNVGGLAGAASISKAIITNCTVSGTVTGEMQVGGLVGESSWGPILTNCGSSCTVTGTEDYTGGIAGQATGTTLTGCYNTGAVNCAGNGGGITGSMSSGNIFDCYNTGDVTTEDGKAGGITSHFSASYGTTSYIANCYNTGTITSNYINNSSYTAGIVSSVSATVCIINCYNTGTITGYSKVAGIVTSTWSSIIACYNVGELSSKSGTSNSVGGITTTTNNSSVSECYFIAEDLTGYVIKGTAVTSVAELNAAVSSMNTAAADFDTAGAVVIKPYTAGSNDYTLPYLGIGGGEPFTYGDAGSSDSGSMEDLGGNGGVGSY